MANEDIFDNQINKEVNAMSIYLTTKAARTALTLKEYVNTRLLAGISINVIKQELLDDLYNNGRMFSEFRRAVKSTARGSINRVRDIGYFSEFSVEINYRWSAVLVNTCPDCLARHSGGTDTMGVSWDGEPKSWEEWEAVGLPRTGMTVCRENCHCVLVPEKYSKLEPIKRGRG